MELTDVLAQRWGLSVDGADVLDGGMNSRTWLIVSGGSKLVAKAVKRGDSSFEPGLELATRLARSGLTTGAPVPSTSGRLTEPWGELQLAVLDHVDGTPLTGTPEDQRAIGTTLARVHVIAQEPAGDVEKWFELVTCLDAYLDLEPWIRPAVESALDAVRALNSLTWAGLHGDPSPEAFIRQPDGGTALIDWGSYMIGPLLYDVASAVMYAGTDTHLIPAYLAARPDLTEELTTGLPAFSRFRHAVQAAYFAWRVSTDDQTGLTTDNGNQIGLTHARTWFSSH
ncbi:phosphotransferase enzyme family protein [Kribbella sp. CA-293567]|uniref:phosphotransferase enzyme family protein n=1 Tax=Kribbella sp. CA-293567 TaxID=3002436 RepID=UPI0022DE54F6|nr:phosphotransferase [Kribbella sp. CA-293567]WBQ06804.1 phosphotransferase [Kribbella sp. CA-293567]